MRGVMRAVGWGKGDAGSAMLRATRVRLDRISGPPLGPRPSPLAPRRPLAVAVLAAAFAFTACSESGEARATLSVAEAMAGDTAGFARTTGPRPFTFPADHGPHDGFRTEWWYFTGNLSADGRDFGYQLTFFRNALRPAPGSVDSDWAASHAFMAHFALTDVAGRTFHAFERFQHARVDTGHAAPATRRGSPSWPTRR